MPDGEQLAVRGLSVSFGGVRALESVNLSLRAGSITAVVGPNGAGKSTLINAIAGLIGKCRGEILFQSRQVLGMSSVEIARMRIGRSFQDPKLIEAESVLENVLCGAHLSMRYTFVDQIIRRPLVAHEEARLSAGALRLLESVGLRSSASRPVADLAYGPRKLVDIVRALINQPVLLLLDEPSSGLDHGERQTLGRLLLDIHRDTKTTFLVVEHNLDLVRAIADRVVALQAGSVLRVGTPVEVLADDSVRSAMVGRDPSKMN
jgi:ABC-type branched-subunit amino acid transport system ATPase component